MVIVFIILAVIYFLCCAGFLTCSILENYFKDNFLQKQIEKILLAKKIFYWISFWWLNPFIWIFKK